MERTKVHSSAMSYIAYDPDSKTLVLEFTSGQVYTYYNVPGGKYLGLMISASKGDFFNRQIKDKYPFNKAIN